MNESLGRKRSYPVASSSKDSSGTGFHIERGSHHAGSEVCRDINLAKKQARVLPWLGTRKKDITRPARPSLLLVHGRLMEISPHMHLSSFSLLSSLPHSLPCGRFCLLPTFPPPLVRIRAAREQRWHKSTSPVPADVRSVKKFPPSSPCYPESCRVKDTHAISPRHQLPAITPDPGLQQFFWAEGEVCCKAM
ncbi:hypothetical protein SRHO_G00113680 [Serrasalmus rhombeus]